MSIFRILGLAKFNSDPTRAPSARARVMWEEANQRGYAFQNYTFLGLTTDAYRTVLNGKSLHFAGIPRPTYTESGSDWWLDDKAVLKAHLESHGIPVPRGGSFSRFAPLLARYRELDKPVIVKPRVGSRSRHTTTNISSEDELYAAFKRAKQLGHYVILEEHLVGSVYRATAIDGTVVGILRGDPPRVVGDGGRTIEELVTIKNKLKHPKVYDVALGDLHDQFLARTGRTRKTVPGGGEVVDLSGEIGIRSGGYSAEEIDITPSETIRVLEEAARAVNDPIIGFDFIIPDIRADNRTQKWGIIECNSAPFINLHHDPVEGEPVNVAAAVWNYMERNADRF